MDRAVVNAGRIIAGSPSGPVIPGECLIAADRLAIRKLKDDQVDYAQLARWLSNPALLEYYEGRDHPYTPELAAATFNPAACLADGEVPCLILFDHQAVGYLQYYPLPLAERPAWGLPEAGVIYGIDLFIGEPGLWSQGLGTKAVRLIQAHLFDNLHVDWVVLDPQASNTRAIRCYEKCGFKKIRRLPAHELHEGSYRDCWSMGITINEYLASLTCLSSPGAAPL